MAGKAHQGTSGAVSTEGYQVKPVNNRKRTGQFPKGVSGNPKGRTPGTKNKVAQEIKVLLDEEIDFREKVRSLDRMSKSNSLRGFYAIRLLLEYRFGKPVERIEIDADIEEKYNLLMQATGIVMEKMV
jgi:hypothetical protein